MTTKRAPQRKRVSRPLAPNRPVPVVIKDAVILLQPGEVTHGRVGHKAVGLASLPQDWVTPFFVVQADSDPSEAALGRALTDAGFESSSKLMVRSSGASEAINQRGALESAPCEPARLRQQIVQMRAALQSATDQAGQSVHWVVQAFLPTLAKGHLSNERRVAEEKRDWLAEVEASTTHDGESHRISLRAWRDDSPPSELPLACAYRELCVDALKTVARWTYERLIRVHYEWVWDGRTLHLVQADPCDDLADGVMPQALVQTPTKDGSTKEPLKVFRQVTSSDLATYRKLTNARIYGDLGYDVVPFYVLDSPTELESILRDGACSDALLQDLQTLTARPLVIRTDGQDIPSDLRQMLPRSDELWSAESAATWLTTAFRQRAARITSPGLPRLADCRLCLIAHHFVPAVASAWCQARPDQRRVRIEALWGIPEGLYWHPYDAFDVDTQVSSLPDVAHPPTGMTVRERRRFKEHFIAPDAAGRWVLHKTAAGPDWQRSITRREWIEEIAWSSRRIAALENRPVVVMWLVGIPPAAAAGRLRPWYHEPWLAQGSPRKATPRRNPGASTDFVLSRRADWDALQERVARGSTIERLLVRPTEPEITRDAQFAKALGDFARQHHIVVELNGGILSHAFYMLARTGCIVECTDLDDYATDSYELEFNKLVRDKIPSAIADRGEAVSLLRLSGEALIAALRRKLVEEALEVLDARTNDQIADELADLREVMLALMSRLKIQESDVESRRKKKVKNRGAFDEALMLTRTAVAPSLALRGLQEGSNEDQQSIAGTIEKSAALPSPFDELHVDRRVDATGIKERLFTAHLPVHASGFRPSVAAFALDTQDGHDHEMVLELGLDRSGASLRLRVRLRNAAHQLELDLGPLANDST